MTSVATVSVVAVRIVTALQSEIDRQEKWSHEYDENENQ